MVTLSSLYCPTAVSPHGISKLKYVYFSPKLFGNGNMITVLIKFEYFSGTSNLRKTCTF